MPSDPSSAADPPAGLDPSRLDMETRQLPLEELLTRLRDGELLTGPVADDAAGWSVADNSRLVESLLIRIPMPALYVDAGDEDRWVVIDGRRRLAALGGFMVDKSYALTGLEYLIELEGDGYDDLDRAQKRRLGETLVTLEIVKPGTPSAIRRNIFRRVGPNRSPQEVREAVGRGPGTALLESLVDGDPFRAATGIVSAGPVDREAALRFLAVFPMAHPPALGRPLDVVLSATLDKLNDRSLDGMLRRHLLAQRFDAAMVLLAALFGGRAPGSGDRAMPVDPALFETWTVMLARLGAGEGDRLLARREEVIKAFTELLHDQDFAAAVAPGIDDPDSVRKRFAAVHDLVEQFVSA